MGFMDTINKGMSELDAHIDKCLQDLKASATKATTEVNKTLEKTKTQAQQKLDGMDTVINSKFAAQEKKTDATIVDIKGHMATTKTDIGKLLVSHEKAANTKINTLQNQVNTMSQKQDKLWQMAKGISQILAKD